MLDFPANPILNQEYTFNEITWVWNGSAWYKKLQMVSSTPYIIDISLNTNNENIITYSNGNTEIIYPNDKLGKIVYRYTTKKIPGLGEFTIDVDTAATRPWVKVNALKDWFDNTNIQDFPLNEQPQIVTYEDYWNTLSGVQTSFSDATCSDQVNMNVFLGLLFISEVAGSTKEPMQLCIQPNNYDNGECGVQNEHYPTDDLDWFTWTSSSTGYPPLFDANFDGVINGSDAIQVANYGYRAYGWGFTTGGGDAAISSTNQINPRFVEGKEYYLWIQAPHPDVFYDNMNRVSGGAISELDGGTF